MKCFVTGASGFIGANLVHELNAQGHEVRVLVRKSSDLRGLQGARYETFHGDIKNSSDLKEGLAGCNWCFHVAASYHLWLPEYSAMYESNVGGTEKVLSAARDAGCSKIVYTSTVGCIGLPRIDQNGALKPTCEETPVSEGQMSNHYKRSKWQAEQVARKLAREGAPVVIVNPSAPIGPRDVKPTPTGKVIVDFLNRQLPAFLDTGLNWVHVRDVVAGHILAAERGRIGERYILGNREGNLTLREALQILEKTTKISAPTFQVPYWVAYSAAMVDEQISRMTGKPPKAPLAGVKMAKYKMFFDPAKAISELGLPQTSAETALKDAVEWFQQNGYVKSQVQNPKSKI